MKIICIDNKFFEEYLTINKIYDGLDSKISFMSGVLTYLIIDDKGGSYYYSKTRFKLVRTEKIKQLL